MRRENFTRECTVRTVVDGDTIDVDIELIDDVVRKARLRFARCNAPEVGTDEGKKVAKLMAQRLKADCKIGGNFAIGAPERIVIKILKKDPYGRYVSEIWHNGENLSDWLLKEGNAVEYKEKSFVPDNPFHSAERDREARDEKSGSCPEQVA